MADFVHDEAEEASSSDDSDLGSDGESKRKKPKIKKKKAKIVDSSEEEEDDEEMDGNLEGFIDDNMVEDEEGSGEDESGPEGGKRKHEESDLEEDLDEDDYDLLDENLGIKVKRKKKRKRIQVMSEDEDSGSEGGKDEKDLVAKEIFDGDEEGADSPVEKTREPVAQAYDEVESGEESEDNFIVDDDGEPIQTHKKKKHIIHDDQALQEAQDIFGVDFDFDEFDQYGDEYSEAEEDEDEDYEEEEEDEGQKRPKAIAKKKKKAAKKTTIYDMFEPSELERYHFTDVDQEIRAADMPERFQLRGIPVCPTEDGELDEEAEWIYKQAFVTPPISNQYFFDDVEKMGSKSRYNRNSVIKGPNTVDKIKSALNFMRNQQFEVPFIAFYRKEYVEPELLINDLWKVYQWDEKWMQLRKRKDNMLRLFEKMQTYQFESIDPDKPLESHVRALTEEDLDRVRHVQTAEQLMDVYQHFLLYYGPDMPKMKVFLKNKAKKDKEKEKEGEGDDMNKDDDEEEEDDQETLKQASRKSGYTMCVQAGLAELARKFGLSPEKFGENLRDNYQRHDVDQDPAEPLELAVEFIKGAFGTAEEALKGAGHMVAMQIAHEPMVRQVIRQVFFDRAMIACEATKKGVKEINEDHPCYTFKFIKNKPLKDLKDEQFLHIIQAQEDGNMTYEIYMDEKDSSHAAITYFEEIRQLYHRDEFSNLVQEWNNQRSAALERALHRILYPLMVREAKTKLIEEAREHVTRRCCLALYGWLKVAPYQADQQLGDEDDDFDSSKGVRVLGIAYSDDREEAAYGALIDGDGEVGDIIRLPFLRTSINIRIPDIKTKKVAEMEKIKDFISEKKPHVIAVLGLNRNAQYVVDDFKNLISELEQEHQMAPIHVELVDSELAVVYSNSKKSVVDYREYPVVLRQAISVARRIQDPLLEFSQMVNNEEDILCLKYHPMQDCLNKEHLLSALYLEFVNRVNEVGVDINRCVSHPYTSSLAQFVCGLGPRKGYNLLKILKQNNSRLENRTQLVVMCHMGPKVFINCAGFIKIDTSALGDSTEAYVEVLDGSRVHPETYEWARKMAVDALEYDDTAEDANPAGALEEILENPERLKDLDLDAFADELERQGYGNKHITLYDIRAELNHRYKDLRSPFRSPSAEEKFNMLTKETHLTFFNGKLILCYCAGIQHKKPQGEQLDQANPVRDDDTGLWQCPFCQKNDFPELSEVWNHFDAGECVGQAVGVRTRLDNGVLGFIHLKNLSDSHVSNPNDRVKMHMPIHARIIKIDIDRFRVDLTCKTSDLLDKDGKWKPVKDSYYDYELEEKYTKKEEDKKKKEARQTYVKRVIVHPQFRNIDYKTCVREMQSMDPGEAIIRPSSKGTDHLTCTWKVLDDIYQHLDVREEKKDNAFSLGRSLWIDTEEFEDLDEIVARFVQPMSQFARDIVNHKYYRDTEGGKREIIEKTLFEEKKKAPSKIPYYFSASRQLPGKFMLSYLPRKTPRHEFVTVTPEGVRYRGQMFHSVNACIRWFKEHFKDPIPGSGGTPQITPRGGSTAGQTPTLRGLDSSTLQRAAAGLPNSVFNTLAQVAGQTPMIQNQLQTPMMTPMMTPTVHPLRTPTQHPYVTPANQGTFATPAQQSSLATPQYQATPRTGAAWPSSRTPHVNRTPQMHSGGGGRTPQLSGGRTPQTTPTGSSRTPSQPTHPPPNTTPSQRQSPRGNPSSQDWAKMAQMWAKRKDSVPGSRRRTPRDSPYAISTPGTPKGDQTPLFDER